MNYHAMVKYHNMLDETVTIEKSFHSSKKADEWIRKNMASVMSNPANIQWIEGDWESAGGIGCNYSITIG